LKTVLFAGYYSALTPAFLYNGLSSGTSWGNVAYQSQNIIPCDGELSLLCVKKWGSSVDWGATVADGYDFEILVNNVGSGVTVSVRSSDGFTQDTVNTIAVSAGDIVTLKATAIGTPNNPLLSWGAVFEGDTAGQSIIMGGCSTTSPTTYHPIGGLHSGSLNVAYEHMVVSTPGTLKNLYVHTTQAPGIGNTVEYEVYKNGVATGLKVTITGANTSGNDIVNTVNVAAGDTIVMHRNEISVPSTGYEGWGVVFEPTTDGEFMVGGSGQDEPNQTTTEYEKQHGTRNFYSIEDRSNELVAINVTAKKLYINITVAPGVGKSYTFTLRDDHVNTALTKAIEDANTIGNISQDVEIGAESFITLGCVPAGTPALTIPSFGILYTAESGWSGKISGITDPEKIAGIDKASIVSVKGVV